MTLTLARSLRAPTGVDLVSDNGATVRVHEPDPAGWCVGCADLGRSALSSCPLAVSALSTVETHGVAVWDARPAAGLAGVSAPGRGLGEVPVTSRLAV